MILEGVIICCQYSDFLAHTLPLNKGHFDKLVVVTSTTDKATQHLCEHHHVQCITTDVFYENGASFNKAKGINEGLKNLSQKGWVLHMDGDIVLPPQFRDTLEPIDLDESFIYGVDRLMCNSYEDWARYVASPHLTQEAEIYIHPQCDNMPIGTRIAKYGTAEGYIPIGFFQLWCPNVSGINHYPQEHDDAGRTDMLFATQWPRNKRGFIPEIIAIHLESEKLITMGKNWKGRKTRHFGPLPHIKVIPPPPVIDSSGYCADEPNITPNLRVANIIPDVASTIISNKIVDKVAPDNISSSPVFKVIPHVNLELTPADVVPEGASDIIPDKILINNLVKRNYKKFALKVIASIIAIIFGVGLADSIAALK